MQNPYREQRLNNNQTQRELARILNITQQSVLMLEQGLFNNVPQSYLNYYPNINPEHYVIWRTSQREMSTWARDANYDSVRWLEFRESIVPSFKGFCVKLYFQPSLLREFEKKWFSRDLLITALSESNVPLGFAEMITERRRVRPSQTQSVPRTVP